MGVVIRFSGVTKLDLDPDQILESAKGKLDGVLIIGFENDGGGTFYAASSYADGGTVLWLMGQCKRRLMDGAAEIERED